MRQRVGVVVEVMLVQQGNVGGKTDVEAQGPRAVDRGQVVVERLSRRSHVLLESHLGRVCRGVPTREPWRVAELDGASARTGESVVVADVHACHATDELAGRTIDEVRRLGEARLGQPVRGLCYAEWLEAVRSVGLSRGPSGGRGCSSGGTGLGWLPDGWAPVAGEGFATAVARCCVRLPGLVGGSRAGLPSLECESDLVRTAHIE